MGLQKFVKLFFYINFQTGNDNQAANLWILLKQKKRKNQIKMANREI